MRKLFTLDVGRTIAHEPEAVVASEISHDRFRIGIDQLRRAARSAKAICGRLDESVIAEARGRKRLAPDAAAKISYESPQLAQTFSLAKELAP